MNPQELLRLIDAISRDRNVDKESLYKDIEQAMISAARKHFNAVDTEEFTSEVDRITGKISIWRGGEEIPLESLGRIPAQTAKQVMIQRFREDERTSIYNEFIDRMGELTTGMAQRYEGGALIVQMGRAEGFMPRSEQIPGEQHQPGERVRCLILEVKEVGSQVKIVLSRAHVDFIRRLFEVEVPEVAERIIEIKAMAREPGHRTKIAVSSIDSKVDAVGACVGVRGSRIKNIVEELGGEKIDIVRWNESSQILIQNSLKPAEVVEVYLCFELGRATVVVNEDQLSLAIGKRGQNVRLAARLTGWDVDILTPAEFNRGIDTMAETLKPIEGISETQIDKLAVLGIISVFDVEEVGANYLVEQLECTPEQAAVMLKICSDKAKIVAEEQAREKEENERRKREALAAGVAVVGAAPGDRQAAAVLGEVLPADPVPGEAGAVAASSGGDSSIISMLEERQKTASESAEPASPPSEPEAAAGEGNA
ncbi:MAG: transcription termination factor NusA [Planctomycetes bacterium]|nr:transcription termination factor NusA [Planctomycetota bacterium]